MTLEGPKKVLLLTYMQLTTTVYYVFSYCTSTTMKIEESYYSYYILYFHANTTAQEPGGKRDREPYHQNGNEKNKVPNCSRACVLFVISLLTNAAATVLYHMIVVLLASRPLLTTTAAAPFLQFANVHFERAAFLLFEQ